MYNIEELKDKTRGRKITILGHDNIDVDAFLSGILLSNLFNFMQYFLYLISFIINFKIVF